jgi:hypothetical protein
MLRAKTLAALLFLLCGTAISQNPGEQPNGRVLLPPPHPRCVLAEATNGETLTVEGNVIHEPHDLAFFLPRCDELVLLAFAGDPDSDVSKTFLHRDKNMRRFRKYTSSLYPSSGTDICIDCSVYGNILAVLTGKIEIASQTADATQKDAGGVVGWGHPTPFTHYRLVIESVSSVKARKRPRP